jgi:hypothetical protein
MIRLSSGWLGDPSAAGPGSTPTATAFTSVAAFDNHPAEVTSSHGDINGDGVADMGILVVGVQIHASDFIL